MSRVIRAALTETRNAYTDMPASVEQLGELEGRIEQVRDANVEHHIELIAAAARGGAQVACLGELFPGPYFALDKNPHWHALAEDARSGPTVQAMQDAASEHRIVLVCPLYELDVSTGKRFNTAVVIESDGDVCGIYRKTHIPEGTNDRASFHETFYYERSDGHLGESRGNLSGNPFFPVFGTSIGKIGVSTCYDRHFPRVAQTLAEQGAELVFCPAVTFGEKSRHCWELEFEVDAVRHGIFIGGSNRRGIEPPWTVEYFGGSYFAGPNGRPQPIDVHPNLVVADLDLDMLSDTDPSGWNFGRDARPEIYG
jgi:N-carbamoylputrescine amidase